MFVCSLYFFSDVMPQLSIFCKTLQSFEISLEGVLTAYQVTRTTLLAYKTDIQNMPFLRRFVTSVLSGDVTDLRLPTLASLGDEAYRACVADNMNTWDKAVRVPFLGHLTQELFEVFDATEPTMKALLLLTTPPRRD